jgi:stage II sporulation protein D
MDRLADTSRGVLGSAILLLIIGGCLVWSLNEATPPGPESITQAASTAPVFTGDSTIRVALTQRPVSTLRLRIEGPFTLSSLDEREAALRVIQPLSECSVAAAAGEIDLCGRLWSGPGVLITPASSPAIWIEGRKYRGSVLLHRHGAQLRAVNVLPLEEYVAAVVDAEMPADFPAAAREAQAIAARTYAVSCRRNPANELFDLYSTPVSQNYLGVVYEDDAGRLLAGETAGGRAAAAATVNTVCTFDGQPFRAYYSACCGGRTFRGEDLFDDADALHAVTCGGCKDAPLYRWQREIGSEPALRRLAQAARSRSPAFRSIASAKTVGDAAAPAVVVISDGVRQVRLPAVEVRKVCGLPSLCFELVADRQQITVNGRGHGHGVGLCQWGAKGLAERGLSSAEILQHYYPGCELSRLVPDTTPAVAEAGGSHPAGHDDGAIRR